MIKEDYVSLETAKLLKEKGFDEKCMSYYGHGEFHLGSPKYMRSNTDRDGVACNGVPYDAYNAPTIQMAVKWLRDVHGLIISVNFTVHGWLCEITKVFRDSNGFIVNINHGIGDDSLPYCDEHEVSSETAIKYCLENLI